MRKLMETQLISRAFCLVMLFQVLRVMQGATTLSSPTKSWRKMPWRRAQFNSDFAETPEIISYQVPIQNLPPGTGCMMWRESSIRLDCPTCLIHLHASNTIHILRSNAWNNGLLRFHFIESDHDFSRLFHHISIYCLSILVVCFDDFSMIFRWLLRQRSPMERTRCPPSESDWVLMTSKTWRIMSLTKPTRDGHSLSIWTSPIHQQSIKTARKKLSLDIFEHLWRQYHWEYYKLINHIFIRSYKMGIITESKTNDFISITSWHFKHFDAKAVGTFVTPCARSVELQLAVWIGLGGINAEPKLSNWHKIVKIRNTKG